jgi:outer membrane usher protein FimD/PapC
MEYNSQFGAFHLNEVRSDNKQSSYGSTNLNFSTSFAMAYKDGSLGMGMANNIGDSAFFVKPASSIKGQKVSLRGSKLQSGLFGEILDPSASSYSFRNYQLDPTELEEGYALEQESYTFAPTYKSVGLIEVGKMGGVALKGILQDEDGLVKNVGGEVIFPDGSTASVFTNGGGRFFIESSPRGKIIIRLNDNKYQDLEINIPEESKGLQDLGEQSLKKN